MSNASAALIQSISDRLGHRTSDQTNPTASPERRMSQYLLTNDDRCRPAFALDRRFPFDVGIRAPYFRKFDVLDNSIAAKPPTDVKL